MDFTQAEEAPITGVLVSRISSIPALTPANAVAAHILNGETAWVNGNRITGAMTVNSLLSFSVAVVSGRRVTATWRNPNQAAGKPYSGVYIKYSTNGYPGTGGTQIYKGVGSNAASGGTSTATFDLPNLGTRYYLSIYPYVTTSAGELLGGVLNAQVTTGNTITNTYTSSTTVSVPTGYTLADIFCVGGGGGGSSGRGPASDCYAGGGGGGGRTSTVKNISVSAGQSLATIGAVITAGTDEETDDSLRNRYFLSFDTPAFGGNISSYRQTILALDGVGAVQVYPAWNGGGTVLCSILGDDLKPALPATVQEVQNYICPPEDGEASPSPNGYGMAPIGAAVTITTGTELTLDITCNIEFAESVQNGVETYQQEIEQKIQEYIDQVNSDWGNPLISQSVSYPLTVYVSRISYAILQISAVVNVTNVQINGSSADLRLTETAQLQQVAALGEVVINGE